MDDTRFRKLALAVLLVNIVLVLAGVLVYAWNVRREVSRPLAPTHNAELVIDSYAIGRG